MQNSIQLNSDIVTKARKENGHTQESIATSLSIKARQIKRIESNGRTSLTTAKLLSDAYKLTIGQLQGEEPLRGNLFANYFCVKKTWNNEEWIDSGLSQGILLNGGSISGYIMNDIKKANHDKRVYPCQYKKVAKITENIEEKEYIIEIEVIALHDKSNKTIKLDRYIIRPFKFIKSGLKWCDQDSWDKNNLQRCIEHDLSTCVTELITEDLPEITDPQYCIHIYPQGSDKENKQYQRQLTEQLKKQGALSRLTNQDVPMINSAFKDSMKTSDTIDKFNDYFPNSNPIGPFYFENLQDFRVISLEVLLAMQPSNMKRHTHNNSSAIVFEANFENEEKRDFLIEFSRISQSQNRTLPWLEENREFFIEELIKWASEEIRDPEPTDYKIRINKEGIEDFMQFCGITV